jgi:acetyl-CoA C-acetyltransferase
MGQAYIVDAVRTAGGRRNGKLAGYHPSDLAAEVLNALVDRNRVDPQAIEDVILGCVTQGGEQSNALGRNAVLASKLPQSVPAVTIDRQCGSSQQAIQFAAQAVMSDTQDVVIACGVESMSRVPMFSNYQLYAQAKQGGGPWSRRVLSRFGVTQFSQFHGAQLIADKYGLTREDLDLFALESHRKASHATAAGAFRSEIVAVDISDDQTPLWHTRDEGIRSDATLSAIGAVKTLEEGGIITAANASQICDGASAVLIVNERGLKSHGLTPLARIHALAVTAGDPVIMLEEPIASTQKALVRAGLSVHDVDLYEVNEAFASVPLAWVKAIGANPEKLNVSGGAIALGHPLGASGTKLMATLVHALKARGLRYGLQTMCEGGGIANTTIVERC